MRVRQNHIRQDVGTARGTSGEERTEGAKRCRQRKLPWSDQAVRAGKCDGIPAPSHPFLRALEPRVLLENCVCHTHCKPWPWVFKTDLLNRRAVS